MSEKNIAAAQSATKITGITVDNKRDNTHTQKYSERWDETRSKLYSCLSNGTNVAARCPNYHSRPRQTKEKRKALT